MCFNGYKPPQLAKTLQSQPTLNHFVPILMIDSADEKTSNSLSEAITVTVYTHYLNEQSQPKNAHYVYSYTITITNHNDVPVQLLSRHWVITEEGQLGKKSQIKEVKGPGVVGQQPVIQPHKSYSYTSGVVMESSIGTMTGSYQMQTLEGLAFEVVIPAFTLIPPYKLH